MPTSTEIMLASSAAPLALPGLAGPLAGGGRAARFGWLDPICHDHDTPSLLASLWLAILAVMVTFTCLGLWLLSAVT